VLKSSSAEFTYPFHVCAKTTFLLFIIDTLDLDFAEGRWHNHNQRAKGIEEETQGEVDFNE
jgi:hypothetical protein